MALSVALRSGVSAAYSNLASRCTVGSFDRELVNMLPKSWTFLCHCGRSCFFYLALDSYPSPCRVCWHSISSSLLCWIMRKNSLNRKTKREFCFDFARYMPILMYDKLLLPDMIKSTLKHAQQESPSFACPMCRTLQMMPRLTQQSSL